MWHTENEMADGNCFSKFKSFFCNIEDFRIIVCYFIMKGEPQWN